MKSLLISDIHGSSLYLKKVLDEVKDFDNLIILGDVLYHGPRNDLPLGYNPKEVVKILNSLKEKIICVKGNCEAYVDEMVLDFPIVESAYFNNGYLNLFLTHGHLINPENPIKLLLGTICLYGHTHIHKISEVNGNTYLNPGSISLAKGDKINSYGIIINNQISIYTYEHKELMRFIQKIEK